MKARIVGETGAVQDGTPADFSCLSELKWNTKRECHKKLQRGPSNQSGWTTEEFWDSLLQGGRRVYLDDNFWTTDISAFLEIEEQFLPFEGEVDWERRVIRCRFRSGPVGLFWRPSIKPGWAINPTFRVDLVNFDDVLLKRLLWPMIKARLTRPKHWRGMILGSVNPKAIDEAAVTRLSNGVHPDEIATLLPSLLPRLETGYRIVMASNVTSDKITGLSVRLFVREEIVLGAVPISTALTKVPVVLPPEEEESSAATTKKK